MVREYEYVNINVLIISFLDFPIQTEVVATGDPVWVGDLVLTSQTEQFKKS